MHSRLRSALANNPFFETKMPGESYSDSSRILTEEECLIREMLYHDVRVLSEEIGERNMEHYDALVRSAAHITQRFKECGYLPQSQVFVTEGKKVENIEVELKGYGERTIIVGAHYDSVYGTRGANDNATGVAALINLAAMLQNDILAKTVKFVAFVNEEPPFFSTENMGSTVYARECKKAGQNIAGMISLETMGYYTEKPSSQSYPFPLDSFYPDTGNFIGFIGNNHSETLLKTAIASFRHHARFPSEGGIMPAVIPGTAASDHWSFWQEGYPAIMITDTAPYRYPYYHTPEDTIDKIEFDCFAKVVSGLAPVIRDLAS